MQDERKVSLGFRRKDRGGGKTGVVYEDGIVLTLPVNGVRRIGHNGVERLFIPMFGLYERIAKGDVKLVEADIVQEHVDPAQVVGRDVYFLSIEALTHIFSAEDFCEFQQKRTGTAGRVINPVDVWLFAI